MARQTAMEALYKIEHSNAYSNLVLSSVKLPAKDIAFATALIYGVTERKLTLDYIIKKYSSKPLNKLDLKVLIILRLGIYQMLFMDTVPESAAVNESVKLAKTNSLTSASGFVNAVLRSFIRDGAKMPEVKGKLSERLSVQYSCPEWFVKRLLDNYEEKLTTEILASSLGAPPTYIRVNTTKTTEDELLIALNESGIQAEKTTVPNCLSIKGVREITKPRLYRDGLFHVQDMTSQICAMNAKGAKSVLDMCAAPGGKTFTMAQLVCEGGEVTAFDLYEKRIKLISDGVKRLGLDKIVKTALKDAAEYDEALNSKYDTVLCDVPCSGFGIIRRKPEIRYKKYEDIEKLAKIQYNILTTSSKYVKIGGTLVYSTCTVFKEENEDIVEKFLKENKNYAPLDESNVFEVFLPKADGGDGFFISKLKRIG